MIQKLDVGNSTPLFKTKVSLIEPFPWKPVEVDMTLDDLMGYEIHANSPLGNLYEVLYTKKERATRLNEGFRGHPSIGAAVVLRSPGVRDREPPVRVVPQDAVVVHRAFGGEVGSPYSVAVTSGVAVFPQQSVQCAVESRKSPCPSDCASLLSV